MRLLDRDADFVIHDQTNVHRGLFSHGWQMNRYYDVINKIYGDNNHDGAQYVFEENLFYYPMKLLKPRTGN